MAAVHAGSWFGLPDFGVTEAIGGLLGAPRTAQGGSNIIGTNKAATPTVQGTTTNNTPYGPVNNTPYGPARPSTGGSVQTSVPVNNNQPQQQQNDPYASIRNDISGAWDNYLNSLNDTTGYLNDQRTAQQGIADSQLQQGINTANDQKAKSLKDIANTTRNAFQAGNNYLGSLGAGDSSAANQYSFAINQQANKQTGDLNNFVSSQIQGLQAQHDQQIQQIASWFAQQQEALKQQIAQGQLSNAKF
jgi:hypothetical protein